MNKTKKILAIRVLAIMMFLTMVMAFGSKPLTAQAQTNSTVYIIPCTKYYVVYYVYPLCKCSQSSIIPEAYKKMAVVNLFENTWSQKEDGSDMTGSVNFISSDKEFSDLLAYVNGLTATKTNDIAPNFTPDFSFTNGKDGENAYDFVFLANQLVMRDPEGNCYIVNISTSKYSELRNYIEGIRLGVSEEPMVGAYSKDRAVTEEDLAVFNEALDGLVGVTYEPTLVSTQVVAGMNYRFTATATPVVLNPVSKTVYVYIYKPLDGPAELVKIEDKV
ncbi:MAG: hypothetical protein FWC47_05905 [Oscillospiraceae bacterium]|nr:hypothetical protein [Oscillospiraceae bacterium]